MINSAKQLLSIGKAGHVLENTYSCGNLRYALMRLSSPGPPHNRRNRMIRSHLESAQARSQSVLLPRRHIQTGYSLSGSRQAGQRRQCLLRKFLQPPLYTGLLISEFRKIQPYAASPANVLIPQNIAVFFLQRTKTMIS